MKKYFLLIAFYSDVMLPSKKKASISLIFVGDIMGHSPQFQAAYNLTANTYNYDICFQQVKPYIEKANFAIANLEAPIAGKPYSGFPNFSSPDELLDAIKKAGFDVLLTANNHILDKGKIGLERTIQQIEKRNLYHLGSYVNKNQRDSIYPLILESNGFKLAFLNCTYSTNGIRVSEPNLINYIDTLEIIADIEKANKLGADIKIMTIHWGDENELHANKVQRNIAKFLVNHGINLIVGSHPHVIQNAEILKDKVGKQVPVFYSLGNFISNQRESNNKGGIMLRVDINTKSKRITDVSYLPVYVYRGKLNGNFQFHLIPTIDFENKSSTFALNKADSISLTDFDRKTRDRLSNIKLIQKNLK
jgi:poly-gamma-glutamate capsule biosynthesis protein CapA/YwtB (metallophosphatase superfamily)